MDFSRVGRAKANSNVMVESCISFPNGEPSTVANGSTCAFVCNSPEQVREFHDVALANGGTSVGGAPGLHDSSFGVFHLWYFRNLDGHKMCGLYQPG